MKEDSKEQFFIRFNRAFSFARATIASSSSTPFTFAPKAATGREKLPIPQNKSRMKSFSATSSKLITFATSSLLTEGFI